MLTLGEELEATHYVDPEDVTSALSPHSAASAPAAEAQRPPKMPWPCWWKPSRQYLLNAGTQVAAHPSTPP